MTVDHSKSGRSDDDDRDNAVDWAPDAIADERRRVADQRDVAAADRDRVADKRDRIADERDTAADDRDRLADEGADSRARRDRSTAGARSGQDRARAEALRQRATAMAQRAAAAADRDAQAAQRRRETDDEVHAVRAHRALTCSAVVVAGIEMLKDHWPRLTLKDRATLLSRVHDNARSVDDVLRLMIVGPPA